MKGKKSTGLGHRSDVSSGEPVVSLGKKQKTNILGTQSGM